MVSTHTYNFIKRRQERIIYPLLTWTKPGKESKDKTDGYYSAQAES